MVSNHKYIAIVKGYSIILLKRCMMDTVKIMQDLNGVQRIVLAYKNYDNEIYIAHSFYYGGRENSQYLIFLYEEPLPTKMKFLDAWNYLDNNSYKIRTVPVDNHAVAVDDYLSIYRPDLSWKDLTYYLCEDFTQVEKDFEKIAISANQVVAFIIN